MINPSCMLPGGCLLILFFVGKHPREKHSGCSERVWERSWFHLLCSLPYLSCHSPLALGGCLTRLREQTLCGNTGLVRFHSLQAHLQMNWQSLSFCSCIFAMLFDRNRNSACILERCLLSVVRERMWQDATVERSCVMSH